MKLFDRSIRIRGRYAAWGAVLAVNVMFAVMTLGVFFVPVRTSAQGAPAPAADANCYAKAECERQGNADFVLGEGCGDSMGKCYARSTPIALAVKIGEKDVVLDIGDYIATTYRYAVGIAAVIAAIMMMIGGFQYLTAGGDTSRVSAGKQRIIDALVGLGLTLGAFTLLNTINPDLVKMRLPRVMLVKRQTFVGCKATELCFPCGAQFGIIMDPTNPVPPKLGDCFYDAETAGKLGLTSSSTPNVTTNMGAENVMATCIGRGCNFLTEGTPACSDDKYRCALAVSETEKPPNNCAKPFESLGVAPAQQKYLCQPCKADFAGCTGTGRNAECCGGFCADMTGGDKCTAGLPGDECDDNDQCASGICQTKFDNSCSAGEVGSPCAGDEECKPGYFCQTNGRNNCVPGTKFSWCDGDSECGLDENGQQMVCQTDWNNVCMSPGESKVGKGCSSNAECANLTNGKYPVCQTNGRNFCTDGSIGAPCGVDSDCKVVPEVGHGICIDFIDTCSEGKEGSRCDGNSDCVSGSCYSGDDFDTCTSGKLGTRCNEDSDCKPMGTTTLHCRGERCLQ